MHDRTARESTRDRRLEQAFEVYSGRESKYGTAKGQSDYVTLKTPRLHGKDGDAGFSR
jgi:hypothetical protein